MGKIEWLKKKGGKFDSIGRKKVNDFYWNIKKKLYIYIGVLGFILEGEKSIGCIGDMIFFVNYYVNWYKL